MLHSAIVAAPNSVARIFDLLGTDEFEAGILSYLNNSIGVDHYTVYRMHGTIAEVVAGASTRGRHVLFPQILEPMPATGAQRYLEAAREAANTTGRPVLLHVEATEVTETDLRNAFIRHEVIDRVLFAGLRGDDWNVVSLLRSRPRCAYSSRELAELTDVADILISAFAKHTAFRSDRGRRHASQQFKSVDLIERHLRSAGLGLTERELQVSARILFGQVTGGIAVELEVGEETVATYRKRAYQRLGIGSRHELFQLYLSLV